MILIIHLPRNIPHLGCTSLEDCAAFWNPKHSCGYNKDPHYSSLPVSLVLRMWLNDAIFQRSLVRASFKQGLVISRKLPDPWFLKTWGIRRSNDLHVGIKELDGHGGPRPELSLLLPLLSPFQ